MTFEYPTNLTDMGFVSLFTYANSVTEGFFGLLVLITIFFVFFLSTKPFYTTPKSLGFASFATLISGIIFRILGLVNDPVLIGTILVCASGLVWMWIEGSKTY